LPLHRNVKEVERLKKNVANVRYDEWIVVSNGTEKWKVGSKQGDQAQLKREVVNKP